MHLNSGEYLGIPSCECTWLQEKFAEYFLFSGCHQEKEETKVDFQAKTDEVQPCESVATVEYKYNFSVLFDDAKCVCFV